MLTRILSSAVLVIFVAAVVLFDTSFPLALNIAIAMISCFAVIELFGALKLTKNYFFLLPSLACAAILPFAMPHGYGMITMFSYLSVMFAAQLHEHERVSFRDVGVAMLMSAAMPAALTTLVMIRDGAGEYSMYLVIVTILAAWSADVGAYFAGVWFGKHKMCPKISPKKTVEGAVGGVITNVFVAVISGVLFTKLTGLPVNYLPLVLVGSLGWLYSVLGDLSFSIIKRSCNIKDFSNVIPGHGGILDRFDSVIFVAPFAYFLFMVLPVVG